MRYVAVLLILASFPMFMSLLKQNPGQRPLAFVALGFMLFLGGDLRVEYAMIAWPYWSGSQIGLDISAVDTLAAALILTRQRQNGRLPFWGLVGFFVGAIWLSLAFSFVPLATFFVCWQALRVMLLFAAVGGEAHNPAMRRALVSGLAMGLILQAGYVAQQKATGVVQATGTMFHQNTLGMMVELGLMQLLASVLGGDRRKIVIIGIVAAFFIIAGGGSRGAISIAGVGAVGLILVSLARGVTPIKLKVTGFMALGIVLAVPLAVWTLKDRFGGYTVTVEDDQRPRFETAARAMANDHPFGVGANLYVTTANVQHYADRAGVAWNRSNRSAPVHNAYLLARAETGWAGELSLWLLLIVPFVQAVVAAFRDRRSIFGEALLGSGAALAVNLVHNNFEFATHTYFVQSLLFMNVAIIASCLRASKAGHRVAPAQHAPATPRTLSRVPPLGGYRSK